jgi:CRISPR-associated protein Csd2
VAFDLEWNSKDQTFDRDLYAFRAFFEYNAISVGILVTRSIDLDPIFKRLDIMHKYGASTTHLDKLIPRLEAGRNGGCPVLVFGITSKLLVENDK